MLGTSGQTVLGFQFPLTMTWKNRQVKKGRSQRASYIIEYSAGAAPCYMALFFVTYCSSLSLLTHFFHGCRNPNPVVRLILRMTDLITTFCLCQLRKFWILIEDRHNF
jgi:hypothetical protein